MAKVQKTDSCWIWIGATGGNGYGFFMWSPTRSMVAHRASWMLHNKKSIPTGKRACHKCDVRKCVNPDHIFIGTDKENIHDGMTKGHYPKGSQSFNAKLDERKASLIRSIYKQGTFATAKEIGMMFGVSKTTILNVKHGKTWKHVCA